jgi:predicted CXXCH cytochrome family protein
MPTSILKRAALGLGAGLALWMPLWLTSADARQEAAIPLPSGLIGSKHDFSAWGRDLCLPCHTAHITAGQAPLLDRRPTTTQPIRPYQTLNVELNAASLLCLSCHDGVTARDIYSTSHATTLADQLGISQRGLQLQSHPIGIRYPIADPKYNPPQTVEAAGLKLPQGRIECTTCHDPHNSRRVPRFLKISNERSRLCLTCHRL